MRLFGWHALTIVFVQMGLLACGSGGGSDGTNGSGGDAAGGSGAGGNTTGSGGAGETPAACDDAPSRPTERQRVAPVEGFSWMFDVQGLADGGATVLWRDSPAAGPRLMFARFNDAGWGLPETVTVSSQSLTATLADSATEGATVAVWSEGASSESTLRAAVRAVDGSWTPTSTIAAPSAGIWSIRAVVDVGEAVTAVWVEEDPEYSSAVYASRLESGSTTWSAPVLLSEGAHDGFVDGPHVQLLGEGTVAVLWSAVASGSGFQTWTNVYDAGSMQWRGAEQLSVRGEYRPSLSTSGSRMLAVWAEPLPSATKDLHASWFDGSTWSVPSVIEPGAADLDDMASAVSPDGTALVMWHDDGSPQQLRYVRYDPNAGSWSSAETLNYAGSQDSQHPEITWSDCHGAFVAHWNHYLEEGLHSAWYDPEAGFSEVVPPVAPSRTFAVDPWGNALFAWADEDSGEVFAQWVLP